MWILCDSCYAIDVVGRGLSDYLDNKALYGYPLYAADCMSVIVQLGLKKVHWVGTSMGMTMACMLRSESDVVVGGGVCRWLGMLESNLLPLLSLANTRMVSQIGMVLGSVPVAVRRFEFGCIVFNDVGPFVPKEPLNFIATYAPIQHYFDSVEGTALVCCDCCITCTDAILVCTEAATYLSTAHATFGPLVCWSACTRVQLAHNMFVDTCAMGKHGTIFYSSY